jgi:hypothetical protein
VIGSLYRYNVVGWPTEKREPVKQEYVRGALLLTQYQYDLTGNIIREV